MDYRPLPFGNKVLVRTFNFYSQAFPCTFCIKGYFTHFCRNFPESVFRQQNAVSEPKHIRDNSNIPATKRSSSCRANLPGVFPKSPHSILFFTNHRIHYSHDPHDRNKPSLMPFSLSCRVTRTFLSHSFSFAPSPPFSRFWFS